MEKIKVKKMFGYVWECDKCGAVNSHSCIGEHFNFIVMCGTCGVVFEVE